MSMFEMKITAFDYYKFVKIENLKNFKKSYSNEQFKSNLLRRIQHFPRYKRFDTKLNGIKCFILFGN